VAYYLDLFSPETYESFSRSDRTVSGFRIRQQKQAGRVQVGDKLICYMTKLSRWVGVLQVEVAVYLDRTPILVPEDDPFVVRFKVKPLVWLEKEFTVPIHDDIIWSGLSFTKNHDKTSPIWTGRVRSSLTALSQSDGLFLEEVLSSQAMNRKVYPIDNREYAKYLTHTVRRLDKVISVSVPQDTDAESTSVGRSPNEVRDSIKIQALLVSIGAKMGLRVWLPRADRASVMSEWKNNTDSLMDILPLNYDETTLRTIEQIDVLWLRGRSIVRAFEVEHTTSIYSGILRMADLLALQPNMDIKLHIVAPYERREKVFQEIRRPVFSLLDKGPLSESCTFISYDSLRELSQQKHLEYLSDNVLEEYAEEAE
jgi:hypothetical protein